MKATDTRTLATKFKEAVKRSKRCTFEIRTAIGNTAGERLHKALSIAGVEAKLIQVVAAPSTGILIETSPDCGAVGVSIQSAFKAVGIDAHLLVQTTRDTNLVVIHLNSDEPPTKAPKKSSG